MNRVIVLALDLVNAADWVVLQDEFAICRGICSNLALFGKILVTAKLWGIRPVPDQTRDRIKALPRRSGARYHKFIGKSPYPIQQEIPSRE